MALVRRLGAAMESYAPLKDSLALYRILSETEPTPEGILGFAIRYGQLGEGVQKTRLWTSATQFLDQRVEPLPYWQWRICWLREIVRIWDLVMQGKRKALSEMLDWHELSHVVVLRHHSQEFTKFRDEWLRACGPRRSPRLAEFPDAESFDQTIFGPLLIDFNPHHPEDPVHLGMVWVLRSLAAGMENLVALRPRWVALPGRAVLQEIPLSLLGAIYLQFAQAVNQDTPARRCEACGRWFEVAPDRSRVDRTTCSGTCRTRLYRDRQERARRLFAQGKKPKQIAKELGSDEVTIRKWITKKGE
jgi:hypothetical protein